MARDDEASEEKELAQEEIFEARHSRFLAKEEQRQHVVPLLAPGSKQEMERLRRVITRYGGRKLDKYAVFQGMVNLDLLDSQIEPLRIQWEDWTDPDGTKHDGFESMIAKRDKDRKIITDAAGNAEADWKEALHIVRSLKEDGMGNRMDWTGYRPVEWLEEASMSQDGWRANQLENIGSVSPTQTARPKWWQAVLGAKSKT